MGNRSGTTLANDMILLCSNTVGLETAKQGIRAFFRYFGGQMVYIPLIKNTGKSAGKIYDVLTNAVGDKPAQKILDNLMFCFGGQQIYVPLERCTFRKITAFEIYERNYAHKVPMNDLAREYGISFNLAYKLWQEGQHEKCKKLKPSKK